MKKGKKRGKDEEKLNRYPQSFNKYERTFVNHSCKIKRFRSSVKAVLN